MKIQVGKIYKTTSATSSGNPVYLKILHIWTPGELKTEGLEDTIGEALMSRRIPFESFSKTNFTRDWVTHEVSLEKTPEEYL